MTKNAEGQHRCIKNLHAYFKMKDKTVCTVMKQYTSFHILVSSRNGLDQNKFAGLLSEYDYLFKFNRHLLL